MSPLDPGSTPRGTEVTVVVPTVGRPELSRLLSALRPDVERLGLAVAVVDDRPAGSAPMPLPSFADILVSGGRGPAAARNAGWRAATRPWIAFLDDDVLPPPGWADALLSDLSLPADVGGSQGRIRVPLPADRRPTDWERNVAGLERAVWATADCAYRREVLEEVGGFDERFRRAFREDADLALRVQRAGYEIVRGRRHIEHPVRPAVALVSLRLQRGNADDVLMRALHGPLWRLECGAEPSLNGRHLLSVVSQAAAVVGCLRRRRNRRLDPVTALALGGSLVLWSSFFSRRVVPGPRWWREIADMALTSLLIPWSALYWIVVGIVRLHSLLADDVRAPLGRPRPHVAYPVQRPPLPATLRPPAAILFDRDGTLVFDDHYNGDPDRVRAIPGARRALARARSGGVRIGVVTNQSGVARGLLSMAEVERVNRRVEELLGPFDVVAVCPHGPDDGCACRKPEPGLVKEAAAALGLDTGECVVIGDIGADMAAAKAAGSLGILVPNEATDRREVRRCEMVAGSLLQAVDLVLGARARAAISRDRGMP